MNLPTLYIKKKKKTFKKKVKFSNVIIIHEVGNCEEHRSARNGLQDLRDQQRFQRRIRNTELILYPILEIKMKQMFFDILPYACIF